MSELSQLELEAIEVKIAETRRAFHAELAKYGRLSRLYSELAELEGLGIDARRARREAEITES